MLSLYVNYYNFENYFVFWISFSGDSGILASHSLISESPSVALPLIRCFRSVKCLAVITYHVYIPTTLETLTKETWDCQMQSKHFSFKIIVQSKFSNVQYNKKAKLLQVSTEKMSRLSTESNVVFFYSTSGSKFVENKE